MLTTKILVYVAIMGFYPKVVKNLQQRRKMKTVHLLGERRAAGLPCKSRYIRP